MQQNTKKYLSEDIIFTGYYGMDNAGDDCFGVVSTWGAKKYWGTNHINLLSHKKLDGPIETYSILKEKRYFSGQRLCESVLQILRSSWVIWSGGSILNSKISFRSPIYLSTVTSRLGITPVGAIGVSLGPYKTIEDQIAVNKYLRRFRFLALRDQASYEEALSLSLPYKPILASDLAMLLPKIIPNFKSTEIERRKILGITVCHYERYVGKELHKEGRREKLLLDTLLELFKKGFEGIFRLFIFNANPICGDQKVTLEFYAKLKECGAKIEIIPYSANPIAIWKQVAECTAMVSTRLHGAIFAAAANVPCCLIEYHRKCNDFLADIGVDQKWLVGDVDCSATAFSEILANLVNDIQTNFYPKREILIKMAEKNFTFVYETNA